tara:strand:- start:754 stop:1218 length:465 start_codon:yes stop_codon:yes gene_type:complete
MGWFSSLGNRISGAVHSLGQKVRGGIKRGRKFVHDHAAQIERVSKTIGDVAGVVGNVATAALPFVAEIPGVNVAVAGLAAGGKAVEAGARWAQKGAGTARKAEAALTSGEQAYAHGKTAIDQIRHGHLIKGYKEGQAAVKGAQSTRKQIEALRK